MNAPLLPYIHLTDRDGFGLVIRESFIVAFFADQDVDIGPCTSIRLHGSEENIVVQETVDYITKLLVQRHMKRVLNVAVNTGGKEGAE